MNARGVVAVVCAGVMASGCAHQCEVAYHAATALDAACAAAGLETGDPELLVTCAAQALTTKRALRAGQCSAHLGKVKP